MTIYLEDMGKVTFPFEPEEQIEKLAAFVTDFVKCPYEPEIMCYSCYKGRNS